MFRTMMTVSLLVALTFAMLGCGATGIKRMDPSLEKTLKSPPDTVEVPIIVKNNSKTTIQVFWIDEDGGRKLYMRGVKPGKEAKQITFPGHYWIVLDDKGKALGIYETPKGGGIIDVK